MISKFIHFCIKYILGIDTERDSPKTSEGRMNITRIGLTNKNIDNWIKGESVELRKWIGFGFYKTKIQKEKDSVIFLYDEPEVKQFEKALEKHLDEELFDKMCNRFFELVEMYDGKNADLIETKMMPINTIFDELSKYPKWGNENMIRRLIRIRKKHHDFIYKLNSQSKPKTK